MLENLNKELQTLTNGKLLNHEILVIRSSTGKKISNSIEAEIKNLLKYVFVVLGLKELPNEVEKFILIDGVKSMLGHFTLDDIKSALTLAMQKVIDFDFNLYDKVINLTYLCDLMNKYEVYRAATMIKFRKIKDEERQKEIEPTEEDKKKLNYEASKKGCLDLFEKCKKGDVPVPDVDFPSGGRFKFLKSLNLFSFTQDDVDEFRKKAILLSEKEKGEFGKKKNPYQTLVEDVKYEKSKLELYIQNLQILNYFRILILSKRELKDEIQISEKTNKY